MSQKPYRNRQSPYNYNAYDAATQELISGWIAGQPAYVITAADRERFTYIYGGPAWDRFVNEGIVPENMSPVWVGGTKYGDPTYLKSQLGVTIWGGEQVTDPTPAQPTVIIGNQARDEYWAEIDKRLQIIMDMIANIR